MSFFKDFKDDFSDAVDEMVNTVDDNEQVEDDMVNTISDNSSVSGDLNKLDELFDAASKKVGEDTSEAVSNDSVVNSETNTYNDVALNDISAPAPEKQPTISVMPASDENAIITVGMTINGDIETMGSIEVAGRINGNISCQGKLTVTGIISGNSAASEVFADAARVDGEIHASGSVKVGSGSMVIGNISATSAVIAGAVKGDIDVQGAVVIDSSAVVMGNVKSESVQINNGAIIEGFCSQAYAATDVASVFKS